MNKNDEKLRLKIKFKILSRIFCTLKVLYCMFYALVALSMFLLIYYYIHLKGIVRKPTAYIVDTPGCHIPDLDPWDPLIRQYLSKPEKPVCAGGKPTLIKTKLNRLYIAPEAVSAYVKNSKYPLDCCHRTFWRHAPHFPGKEDIKTYSNKCTPFVDTVIHDDYVMVQCFINHKEIYRDYFAFVQVKPEVEARCDAAASSHKTPDISVLIMGIDGMSRNHLYRNMPRTVALLRNMSAVDMAGVNVVGRHTIINLVPLLTGLSYNELQNVCWPKPTIEFDLCPWIFRNASQIGYRTAYGETLAKWSMYINGRAGFRLQPTDYYLQPAIFLEDKWKDKMMKTFCFGTRIESEILVDFINTFVTTMKSNRFFGLFWDGRLTYHTLNVHSTYDVIYETFLRNQIGAGLFNRTILILLSDHGYRWGKLRESYQGLHEQRNPFLFFMFPDSFKQKYKMAIKNIYNNTKRLVTAYDVHETLKDIFNQKSVLEDEICINRTEQLRASSKLPRGISLFLPILERRTCSDATIDDNLCLCQLRDEFPVNNDTIKRIAGVLIKDLSKLVAKYPQCSRMTLDYIHSAWIHRQNKLILQSMDSPFNDKVKNEISDLVDYTVIIKTNPGGALFEATYRYRPGSLKVLSSFLRVGDIQRINMFGNQSYCISDVMLKPYCYCKN